MNNTIVSASPFDRIAKRSQDGTEYWSARDLMELMGYPTWQHFYPVIERAMASAHNQGHNVEGLFKVIREKSNGGRPREEIFVFRFAAYLVAMNGDPRKPEIAAAQEYFAVMTHRAETQPAPTALSRRDLARMVIESEDAREVAEARAVKAESTVTAIEAQHGITCSQFHKHYFPDTPAKAFFEKVYALGLLIDQRGSRGRDAKGRLKNGYEHQHPSYKGKPYFYLHGSLDKDGVRRERTLVRPGNPEVELARHLSAKGLPLNPSIKSNILKEIAA